MNGSLALSEPFPSPLLSTNQEEEVASAEENKGQHVCLCIRVSASVFALRLAS